MIEQMKKMSSLERLRHYLTYLKNKDQYSPEEQAAIEDLFEEDG